MKFAIDDYGGRIEAQPGRVAYCPCCNSVVVAKCGEIKIWHWSHQSVSECDPWWETETKWHRHWKSYFPAVQQEVVIGCHRADVRRADGTVIEFQHSPIDAVTIKSRELFYGKMIWVVDASLFEQNFSLRRRQGEFGVYYTFRWKWPRLSWANATKPVYLHFGCDDLFQIKRMYNKTPCGGWGLMASTEDITVQPVPLHEE